MEIRNILVIRFRQMGDMVMATPLLDTLHLNYPHANIDLILNARIAPLFEGHPSVNRIITFTDEERHHAITYIKKVWQTVHQTHYDAIIDMRSTLNTMLFSFFSIRTPLRIGVRKSYNWGIFNYRIPGCLPSEAMIDHNLNMTVPLQQKTGIKHWQQSRKMTLGISDDEKREFRQYMQQQGIDFSRPVMLAGVTAKLAHKTWAEERMTKVLQLFIERYPSVQIIFNFAPGKEAENAGRIYQKLGQHPNIFLNIEAKSMRLLAAMSANCTFYFGNEGGARHIIQAMGRPSFVVCSPAASKTTWLPENDEIPTRGLAPTDIDPDAMSLSYDQQYHLITAERVWQELQAFCSLIQIDK